MNLEYNAFGFTLLRDAETMGGHTMAIIKCKMCDISSWTDIVAVTAGDLHTVGLKANGTVVAVGQNDDGQCNVSGWTDIKLPDR